MRQAVVNRLLCLYGQMLHHQSCLLRPAASSAVPRRPQTALFAFGRPMRSPAGRPDVAEGAAGACAAAAAAVGASAAPTAAPAAAASAASPAAVASTSASNAPAAAPYGRPPRRLMRTVCASVGQGGRPAGTAVKAPPSSKNAAPSKEAPDADAPWLIVGLGACVGVGTVYATNYSICSSSCRTTARSPGASLQAAQLNPSSPRRARPPAPTID
jgi:DNA polymerase-3 subunit gamma/tau